MLGIYTKEVLDKDSYMKYIIKETCTNLRALWYTTHSLQKNIINYKIVRKVVISLWQGRSFSQFHQRGRIYSSIRVEPRLNSIVPGLKAQGFLFLGRK